jgi:hypothetical protein
MVGIGELLHIEGENGRAGARAAVISFVKILDFGGKLVVDKNEQASPFPQTMSRLSKRVDDYRLRHI